MACATRNISNSKSSHPACPNCKILPKTYPNLPTKNPEDPLFVSSGFSPKHKTLLVSYVLNLNHGPGAVREMIVADIRAAIDLRAPERAADLLLVLRVFLFEHPEARMTRRPRLSGGRRHCEDPEARRIMG